MIIVPLDGSSDTSVFTAVELLKTKYGIKSLDLVIANAGIATFYGTALQTSLEGTREHLQVNVVGVLALFQAVYPLLSTASAPKFVPLTSTIGSIGEMQHIPVFSTAYGASKAALNYITRKIHFENPGIIAFPINPGYVLSLSNLLDLEVWLQKSFSDCFSIDGLRRIWEITGLPLME